MFIDDMSNAEQFGGTTRNNKDGKSGLLLFKIEGMEEIEQDQIKNIKFYKIVKEAKQLLKAGFYNSAKEKVKQAEELIL